MTAVLRTPAQKRWCDGEFVVLLCRVEDQPPGISQRRRRPTPIETSEGWLVIYHGVRENVAARCAVRLLLLDLDDPTVLRSRSCDWVLGPTEAGSRSCRATFPASVFQRPDPPRRHGRTAVVYGPACIAMATAQLTDVLAHMLVEIDRHPRMRGHFR